MRCQRALQRTRGGGISHAFGSDVDNYKIRLPSYKRPDVVGHVACSASGKT